MKVLLIDDHPLILTALQNVIQGIGNDVSVVGVAQRARRRARRSPPTPSFDLVLLDLRLGDADGFDLLVELRNAWPAVPVVVVSASDRSADVIRSIDLGAMGFVPKRASNETLIEALHVVMSGGIYVPPMTMGSEADAGPSRRRAAPAIASNCAAGEATLRPTALADVQADAAPDRRAGAAAARPVEQADRARARPLGRDRQGPRRRGAARARRQLAHPGRARRQPDVEPGWHRAMAAASARTERGLRGRHAPPPAGRAVGARGAARQPSRCCATRSAAPSPSTARRSPATGRRGPDRPDPRRRRAAAAAASAGAALFAVVWLLRACAGLALSPGASRRTERRLLAAAAHLAGRRARRRRALGRGGLAVLSPTAAAPQQLALVLVVYTFCVACVPILAPQFPPVRALRRRWCSRRRSPRVALPAARRQLAARRRDDGGDGDDRSLLGRNYRDSFDSVIAPEAAHRDARRAAARREGGGRRGAARGRGRQPRQDPVLHRRQPRPAPAAARDGPVRRGAAPAHPRARGGAARQQHQRIGRRARGPVLRAARHHPDRQRRRRGQSAELLESATSSASCACTSSRRRSRRGWRCASAAASTSRSPTRCWSSASCATCSRTRSATPPTARCWSAARRRGERLLLQVWDTGPGIREERAGARLRGVLPGARHARGGARRAARRGSASAWRSSSGWRS